MRERGGESGEEGTWEEPGEAEGGETVIRTPMRSKAILSTREKKQGHSADDFLVMNMQNYETFY